MAIICRDYRLVFVMVPGTGCSVVGGALRRELGGEWLPERDLFEGSRLLVGRKHCSVPQLLAHGILSPRERREYTVFATVRNPYDRLVTEYQRLVGAWTNQKLQHEARRLGGGAAQKAYLARRVRRTRQRVRLARALGFDGWLLGKLAKWRFDTRWMSSEERQAQYDRLVYPLTEGVDRYLRYERLEDDLNRVLADAGVTTPIQLPRRNQTPGKAPYPSYYSALSRGAVERMLAPQLARFGYEFDEAVSTDLAA